ncbi:hypothetical protein PRIPAC_93472 [Pristionchus pacificus]|uniref:Uncharacterized protein n=1 Tax=Pristionchus pacificus TaxID=54126 RepID=A0A2A6BPN8_PRIPA|nr:hypothetical protein PRIPAC_93472 [Pristionchus pacificus]|eukprot:PDM67879.1 hypothetical protein PRIPAC_45923 [Pristionchus pacificus]
MGIDAAMAIKPILIVSIGLEAVICLIVVILCIFLFLAIKKVNEDV